MAELTSFYALLIGIDRYDSNPYYKDLKGCVQNINLIDRQKTEKLPEFSPW